MRQWYDDMSNAPSAQRPTGAAWDAILAAWDAIDMDFDALGHDLTARLDDRPWRWFAKRVSMLIANPRSLTYIAINGRTDSDAD